MCVSEKDRERKRERQESESLWMYSEVNCEDYLCLADDDTLGAVLYKLEGEREGVCKHQHQTLF